MTHANPQPRTSAAPISEALKFRDDLFGLLQSPPPNQYPWLEQALKRLWQSQRLAFQEKIQAEFYNTLLPFSQSTWWFRSSSVSNWNAWYQQSEVFWQCFRALKQGGKRQHSWHMPSQFTEELSKETPKLWYFWASLFSQAHPLPTLDTVNGFVRKWLSEQPYLERFELDLQVHPSINNGQQVLQQSLLDNWNYAHRVMLSRQWLPIRVFWRSEAQFCATDNQLLLIYHQETPDSLLCYEPSQKQCSRLFHTQEGVWWETHQLSIPLSAMYPVAAPCKAITAGWWLRLRHALGYRAPV